MAVVIHDNPDSPFYKPPHVYIDDMVVKKERVQIKRKGRLAFTFETASRKFEVGVFRKRKRCKCEVYLLPYEGEQTRESIYVPGGQKSVVHIEAMEERWYYLGVYSADAVYTDTDAEDDPASTQHAIGLSRDGGANLPPYKSCKCNVTLREVADNV